MDLKSIIGIAIVAVGVFMIFKDQLLALLKSNSTQSTPVKEASVQVAVNRAANQACLGELEDLVRALDQTKDTEEIDYLIDKLGPKLIRRRLGK